MISKTQMDYLIYLYSTDKHAYDHLCRQYAYWNNMTTQEIKDYIENTYDYNYLRRGEN